MAAARVLNLVVILLAGRVNNIAFKYVASAWDGGHYIRNADLGYPDHPFVDGQYTGPTIAFYPLFSLVLRAAHAIAPFDWVKVGVVVSFVFALTAAAAMWLVLADWAGRETATRAIVLIAFFPGSYVFSLIYAEGLMLTLAGGTLFALRRRQWLAAGILGALCTATRPNAVVIAACCAWSAVVAIRREREWQALAAPLLAPLGAVAFHLYLWRHTGEPWAWFDVQRNGWLEKFDPLSVFDFIDYYLDHPLNDFQGMTVLTGTVILVAATCLLVRDRPPAELLIWTIGIAVLVVTSSNLGVRPRFVTTAFPLFVPVARRLSPTLLGTAVGVLGIATGWLIELTVTSTFIVP